MIFASAPLSRLRLGAEFATLYLVTPFVMAVFLPPNWMFPVLFALTGVGLVLLATTPDFQWQRLAAGLRAMNWPLILVVCIATTVAGTAIVLNQRPEAFLMARRHPELMLMIAVLYPVLSALPQELVFRPLFFERYASILPKGSRPAILLNAGVFAFAHLMYWNWVVAVLTFLGGLVFAHSYRERRNFPEAVLAHSLAGVILFALGMGVYFYSGNVTRPF